MKKIVKKKFKRKSSIWWYLPNHSQSNQKDWESEFKKAVFCPASGWRPILIFIGKKNGDSIVIIK